MLVALEMWEPTLGSTTQRLYFPHPVSHLAAQRHLARPALHVVCHRRALRHASAASSGILPHAATSFSLSSPGCRIHIIVDRDDGVEKGEEVSREGKAAVLRGEEKASAWGKRKRVVGERGGVARKGEAVVWKGGRWR